MSTPKPKLRGKISSDVTSLDKLQVFYKFIPTASRIRPSETGKAAKAARLDRILATYVDMPDYIYHTVFGRPVVESAEFHNKLEVEVIQDPDLSAFTANEFPYDIELGNHSIMWYAVRDKPKSDDHITEDIDRELRKILKCGEAESHFDFAWYENPKMSIPEFYHVQVFWVETN